MSELLVEAKNSEDVFKGRGNLDFSWEISVNIRYLLLESVCMYIGQIFVTPYFK